MIDEGEECDDGNRDSGDLCSPVCTREPSCGDGFLDEGEECDDGDNVDEDGCSSTCVVEFCGDGTLQGGLGEECDDGGTDDDDGCSSVCRFESCGDGIVQSLEECDDGNETDDDGCSRCSIDPFCGDGEIDEGEECDDGGTEAGDGCDEACVAEVCGDGLINNAGTEECDDGNTDSGDGCDGACVVEFCGDGAVNNGDTEGCDDGNTDDGDGCDASCVVEFCGDGTVNNAGTEACDDGNTDSGDGCDASCVVEFCGDGTINNGDTEACDDGNTESGDGCDASCVVEFCGDGIVNNAGAEGCDDGNNDSGDGCDATCGDEGLTASTLVATDDAAGDTFGAEVALDGDYAIIGAPNRDGVALSNSGSAFVFVRSGGTWTQQAELTASDAATDDLFGISVSISGDTAIVGAHQDDDDGSRSGSAYVFVRAGTTWTQQAKLTASDAASGDRFGSGVSISGESAIISAPTDDDDGSSSGSAYVFVRAGTTWSQQAKLTASDDEAGDHFGTSVSVSGDTALVGANLEAAGGGEAGAAYVFVRSGVSWSQQAKLTASDAAADDEFGESVSVSGDQALVGARLDDDAGSRSGSAYLFSRAGTTWTQQKLVAPDAAAGDRFGSSVSISAGVLLIGAEENDDGGSNSGSAYIFD